VTDFIFKIYGAVWCLVLPLLKKKERLADGWSQRIGSDLPRGSYDIWIQSASGGESLLTAMVLQKLATAFSVDKKLRVIVSSMTRQGVDILIKCVDSLNTSQLEVDVIFFPFDSPKIMKAAYETIKPRLIVVMETELWPSFLVEAKKREVPFLLVNGRMSEKSYRLYKYLKGFFSKYGPDHVWAISQDDCQRFTDLCGKGRADLMNNIKFDRMVPQTTEIKSELRQLFTPDKKIVLFGSIRKEEETAILEVIKELRIKEQEMQIALFPKHVERADNWLFLLEEAGINAAKRSTLNNTTVVDVLVWDIFGELASGYGIADAIFVGGSLVDLGGQNFLEPLAHGVRPIIGPYWSDFFWVGREIVDAGLVIEVNNQDELSLALVKELNRIQDKARVKVEVEKFLKLKQGGSQLVCREIVKRI